MASLKKRRNQYVARVRWYLLIFSSFLFAQDIAGSYQFYGLYIMHQSVARYDTEIEVSDIHGVGLTLQVDSLQAGEIYTTTYQGPYGHLYAASLNLVLNVNFYEDGTGEIAEGSYYPTEELDELLCTADIVIQPITDELIYTSDLNADLIFPGANILGSIPDGDHDHPNEGYRDNYYPEYGYPDGTILIHAEESAGSIALTKAEFFDLFPSNPVHPTLCDGLGNCFDVILESGETISGGDPLPGLAGGYVLKGNLPSIAPSENGNVNLYIEWHAIDGPISQSGLGDIIDEDEDGDGTDFDRIWALESLMATYLNPGCGYNYPIFGDVTTQLEGMDLSDCIDRVDIATQGYIFDESGEYSNVDFGYLVTYHSLTGGVYDSDHDYNGTDGRLVMQFDPMCIPDINVRHIMLEFLDISCNVYDVGDINTDGIHNVLDIVSLANCVLTSTCENLTCSDLADLNGDGTWNVLDIVSLANCVLASNCDGGGRVDDATESRLIMNDNIVSIEADGFIGGVQMTLTHGDDFTIDMTDRALLADYITEGNETRLLVITPETDELFSFEGDFEIAEIIVANSYAEVSVSLPLAASFRLSDAYPNPFNPTTTMELFMPVAGDMQVEVYNLLGQVVATLASGYMDMGTYTLTWDASDAASSMYFVKAQAEGFSTTQKLMLVK